MPRPTLQTSVPTIACFNLAKTPLDVDFDALVAAMQKFLDEHFVPVWATPARLVKTRGFMKGAWALVFHDSCRDADTEGYHDITREGLPMARVFVKNILKLGDQVSVTASHELAEMLVDPLATLYTTGPRPNRLYDYEVADPVEEQFFPVDGINMSDFVYPAYFECFHKPGSMRFDHNNTLTQPFELHEGGYQSYWSSGKERTQWGSKKKKVRFLLEDRRGHRSEVRGKHARKVSTAPFAK